MPKKPGKRFFINLYERPMDGTFPLCAMMLAERKPKRAVKMRIIHETELVTIPALKDTKG